MNRESLKLESTIIASDTQELYDLAKSKGIQMPHPSLSIFKSILASIEEPNGNGVRLAKKATEAAVSTLVGCQINRNHLRTGYVLGHVIDASINKSNDIEIVCIFFKDIYAEEWEEAQELFAKGKLTMSFELSADVESQDKLADGTKRLNDYYFTGAGLLFGVKPACKKARVFEMAAKKLQEKLSMERQSLIFANNQNSQKSIMEVLKLMADEVKKIEEPQVASEVKVEASVEAVKVEEPVKVEETKVEAQVETPKVEEAKVEAPVVEEKAKVEEPVKVEEVSKPVVAESNETVTQSIQVVQKEVVTTPDTTKVTTVVQEADKTTYPSGNSVTHVITQETVEQWVWEQVQAMQASHEKEVKELKAQLDAKEKELIAAKELVAKKEEKIEAKVEEPVVLATGHKKIEASDSSVSPIAKILKNKKAYRK